MKVYFFARNEPPGITVGKQPELPDGDFQVDEYCWPNATLWFIKKDRFTDDERQEVYNKLQYAPKEVQHLASL